MTRSMRARSTQLLASVTIAAAILTATPMLGVGLLTPAQAQYVVDAEFRIALSPYGRWQNHERWSEVWLPDPVPADWRPYTRGRWIYTDDWGWYWEAADEEAAWGWVAYHYGRWLLDRDLGWIWVPGEDWGPAWVDWRYGDDHVGWAPLPPDDLLVEYQDDPIYWSFVHPRYLLAPRVFLVLVPPRERVVIIRRTKIVNRTVTVDRDRGGDRDRDRDRNGDRDRDRSRARVAVNAGIDPGIIARASGRPIRAAKVEPAVLKGTKVDGAREVDAREGGRARTSIKETGVVIKPANRIEPPKELGPTEKGRLGERPPKAAQTGSGPDDAGRAGEDRSRSNRSSDQGRSPASIAIRGGANDTGRSSPPSSINVIRGVGSDSGRSASSPPAVGEPGNQQRMQIQSPPPPPVVQRSAPPPPPQVMRAPPPPLGPSAAEQRQRQEQRGNRQNRQQDERIR